MTDVTAAAGLERVAIAQAEVQMQPATLRAIRDGKRPKGDVLATARIAGIMAAKRTSDLIPLCHPSLLTSIAVNFTLDEGANRIVVRSTVRATGPSGIDMEALTAVSVAALTIYDMAKGIDRGMTISAIQLLEKRGGKTGDWQWEG
jgi:cyclic pyranopterin phosphate synthase